MTAAPEEFSTLFVMSLKARFTEKLLPCNYGFVCYLFIIIGGCVVCVDESWPMPVA